MKEDSEEEEKEEKRKKEPEEQEAEESEEVEDTDFNFHDRFSEIKDATPLFKPSDLEQFVSQAEVPIDEKKSEKENKEQIKYSLADYTTPKDMEWHEKDMVADVDDLRRIGTFVDRKSAPEFRRDFSIGRPMAEMPELSEMKGTGTANEMIVKYADKRKDNLWKEGMDSMRRKDIKKYKTEA